MFIEYTHTPLNAKYTKYYVPIRKLTYQVNVFRKAANPTNPQVKINKTLYNDDSSLGLCGSTTVTGVVNSFLLFVVVDFSICSVAVVVEAVVVLVATTDDCCSSDVLATSVG